MILFLEYSSGRVRGGEIYNAHLHQFLKSRFKVFPDEVQPIPHRLRNPLRHFLYSLRLVKSINPELIVSDISSGIRNLGALWWMKKYNKKSLLIIQEERLNLRWDNSVVKWLVRKAERYLVSNSDIFVVNSEYSANLARKKNAPARAPIIIAHPGIENFAAGNDIKIGISDSAERIFELLFIGVCKEHKGLIYLAEAVNLLKEYRFRVNIVGQFSENSRYYKRIRKFILKNNLDNRIVFHGFVEREKLAELFRKSELYVHPSLMEGYGMALAEAMCYGLPIVSTTAGAIPELVKSGVNGILVNPGDAEELAAAIKLLYEDAGLRNTISLNNLEKAKTLDTWEENNKKLESELTPAIEEITGLSSS
jgi:glycosyltransferase involved in cell wall biosynthesis